MAKPTLRPVLAVVAWTLAGCAALFGGMSLLVSVSPSDPCEQDADCGQAPWEVAVIGLAALAAAALLALLARRLGSHRQGRTPRR